jgi:hypothetical protein
MRFGKISSSLIRTQALAFMGDFLEIGIHPWSEQKKSPNSIKSEGLGIIKINPI